MKREISVVRNAFFSRAFGMYGTPFTVNLTVFLRLVFLASLHGQNLLYTLKACFKVCDGNINCIIRKIFGTITYGILLQCLQNLIALFTCLSTAVCFNFSDSSYAALVRVRRSLKIF